MPFQLQLKMSLLMSRPLLTDVTLEFLSEEYQVVRY